MVKSGSPDGHSRIARDSYRRKKKCNIVKDAMLHNEDLIVGVCVVQVDLSRFAFAFSWV